MLGLKFFKISSDQDGHVGGDQAELRDAGKAGRGQSQLQPVPGLAPTLE